MALFSKESLAQFTSQVSSGGRTSSYYMFKDGINRVRFFVSPNESKPMPFFERHTHWYTNAEGKRESVICPARTPILGQEPQRCPICDYVKLLYKSNNAAMVEQAKQLHTSKQYLQWAFVRSPEDAEYQEKPALVSVSKTLLEQILGHVQAVEEDGDDITEIFDLTNGVPVMITRSKGAGRFPYSYTATLGKRAMVLTGEPYAKGVAETVSIMADILKLPTETELAEALELVKASVVAATGESTVNEEEDDEDQADAGALAAAARSAKSVTEYLED